MTEAAVEAPPEALAFFDDVTRDPQNPVIVFALQGCSYCWAVRKFFDEYRISYRPIDLDSPAYRQADKGEAIRKAIEQRTGLRKLPQVFVGGTHVGGATETFAAWKDGTLAKLLDENKVSWERSVDTDPYSFLPAWL